MMETVDLTDVMKSLPNATGTAVGVVVKDALGNQYSKPLTEFGLAAIRHVAPESVLKISNIGSVFVSIRGSNSGRCSLIWASSYGGGSMLRTTVKAIHPNPQYYEWYVNGESESPAALYLKLLGTYGSETLGVISILGEMPVIESVSSIPSDARRVLDSQ